MIKQETIKINNKSYRKTTSDSDKLLRKVGTDEIYSEAIDLLDNDYQYEEIEE